MNKVASPCLAVLICCVVLTCVILLPKTTAHKKHNVDEFLVEDQRTHTTKQNYVMQRGLKSEILGDNLGVAYAVEPYEAAAAAADAPTDELPALIVDYANMIRNDIILLDNSVETRTRKRGNIKVERDNKVDRDLGEDTYPRYIETRICSEKLCSPLTVCQKSLYNVTVLKRRSYMYEKSEVEVPEELRHHWIARRETVTVGCACVRDYIELN